MGDVSLFRALHFESTTLVVQSFKDLVSQGDLETSTSKKVPIPEKRAMQRMMDVMAASAPPGYCKVTPQQVVRADQELWLLLAREVPGLYKVDSTGTSPLDSHFQRLMLDPRVTQFLLPLPKAMASGATEGQEGDYQRRPPKGRGKGRGNKGKPSTPRTPRNLPEAFKGMQTRTEKGNICFAFNTEGGCSNQTRKVPHGIRCDKGLHICIKCHREGHGLTSCRRS